MRFNNIHQRLDKSGIQSGLAFTSVGPRECGAVTQLGEGSKIRLPEDMIRLESRENCQGHCSRLSLVD